MPEIDIALLVRASDPAGGLAPTGPGVDGVLEALGAAIASSPVPPARSRRRYRRLTVVALAVVAILVGVGVATGAIMSARTGIFPSGPNAAVGGPGEELNPAAPDFRAVALQIASDIPYPSGYASWRDRVVSLTSPSGLVSTGALHGWFAMSAFCAWVRDWDHAVGVGDAAEAATAAATIAQAPDWRRSPPRIRIRIRTRRTTPAPKRLEVRAAQSQAPSSAGSCPTGPPCSPATAHASSSCSRAATATAGARSTTRR